MVWLSSFFYIATKQSTPCLFVTLTQQIGASSIGGNKRRQPQQAVTTTKTASGDNDDNNPKLAEAERNTRRQPPQQQVVKTRTTINYSLPPNKTLGDKDNTWTTTTPMQQSTIEHAFCDDGLCRLIFVVVSGVFCIGGVYRGFVDLYRLYRPPCIGCIGVVSFVSGCIVCIGICIVCIGCCFEQLYRLYRVVSTLAKCADSCIFLSMYSNLQKYQYR